MVIFQHNLKLSKGFSDVCSDREQLIEALKQRRAKLAKLRNQYFHSGTLSSFLDRARASEAEDK